MAAEIRIEEWLAELERLSTPNKADGHTIPELMQKLGMSRDKLRKLLRQLHADGRLRTARRLVTNIAGGNQSIPVYSVAPVSKGRRK